MRKPKVGDRVLFIPHSPAKLGRVFSPEYMAFITKIVRGLFRIRYYEVTIVDKRGSIVLFVTDLPSYFSIV